MLTIRDSAIFLEQMCQCTRSGRIVYLWRHWQDKLSTMDSSSQLAVISILHLCDGSVNTPLFQKPLEERLAPAPALTSIQLFFRSPPSSLPPVSPSQLSDFSSHTPAFTPQSLCQALCLFQWYLASENIKKKSFYCSRSSVSRILENLFAVQYHDISITGILPSS